MSENEFKVDITETVVYSDGINKKGHRATIRTDKASFRHLCAGDANDAVTGLILEIGRFKTEAIAAISKHMREVTK